MEFAREVHEHYQRAYALGIKNQQDKKKQHLPVCPAARNTLLDEKMVSYSLDLGILKIPTNLIVGADEEAEKTMLYTKGFLPVSAPNSEYADCWRSLYHALHSDAHFAEEITCYEYLGKFYVRDGLKRVSVSKYAGVPSMKAHVIRILPLHTGDQEVSLYFDFLKQYRFTQLYQLQFTQPGFFEKLQHALGRNPAYLWSDSDRESFLRYWPSIEHAFRRSYGDSLRISAADALVVLTDQYSFDQIKSMDSWVLARVFQTLWKELYALSFPGKGIELANHKSDVLQTA